MESVHSEGEKQKILYVSLSLGLSHNLSHLHCPKLYETYSRTFVIVVVGALIEERLSDTGL